MGSTFQGPILETLIVYLAVARKSQALKDSLKK